MTEVNELVEDRMAMIELALKSSQTIQALCIGVVEPLGNRNMQSLEQLCFGFYDFLLRLSADFEPLEAAQTGQTLSKITELSEKLQELNDTVDREPFNEESTERRKLKEEVEKLKDIFRMFFSLHEKCQPKKNETSTVYDVPPIVKIYLLVAVLVVSNQIDKGIDFVMLCLIKLVFFMLLILVSYHTLDYSLKVSEAEGIWPHICKMWNYENKWEAVSWPYRLVRRLWTGPQLE